MCAVAWGYGGQIKGRCGTRWEVDALEGGQFVLFIQSTAAVALLDFGFQAGWIVQPRWNLCNAPGGDNGGKVSSVSASLESDDRVLACRHTTFHFAVNKFGVGAFKYWTR